MKLYWVILFCGFSLMQALSFDEICKALQNGDFKSLREQFKGLTDTIESSSDVDTLIPVMQAALLLGFTSRQTLEQSIARANIHRPRSPSERMEYIKYGDLSTDKTIKRVLGSESALPHAAAGGNTSPRFVSHLVSQDMRPEDLENALFFAIGQGHAEAVGHIIKKLASMYHINLMRMTRPDVFRILHCFSDFNPIRLALILERLHPGNPAYRNVVSTLAHAIAENIYNQFLGVRQTPERLEQHIRSHYPGINYEFLQAILHQYYESICGRLADAELRHLTQQPGRFLGRSIVEATQEERINGLKKAICSGDIHAVRQLLPVIDTITSEIVYLADATEEIWDSQYTDIAELIRERSAHLESPTRSRWSIFPGSRG